MSILDQKRGINICETWTAAAGVWAIGQWCNAVRRFSEETWPRKLTDVLLAQWLRDYQSQKRRQNGTHASDDQETREAARKYLFLSEKKISFFIFWLFFLF